MLTSIMSPLPYLYYKNHFTSDKNSEIAKQHNNDEFSGVDLKAPKAAD